MKKEMMRKTAALGMALALSAGAGFGLVRPEKATAAVVEQEVARENFHGEGLDLYDWRYRENMGIDVERESAVVQMLDPLNGTGLTTLAKYGGKGVRVEAEFERLVMSGTGFFGFVLGASMSADNVNILQHALGAQTQPMALIYFVNDRSALKLAVQYRAEEGGAIAYKEYVCAGFTPADAVSSIIFADQTVVLEYGADGAMKVSLAGDEPQVLAEEAAGLLPALDGHAGMTTMEPGIEVSLRKFDVSDGDGGNKSALRDSGDAIKGVFSRFEYAGTKRFYTGTDNLVRFGRLSDLSSTLVFRHAVRASANVPDDVLKLEFKVRPERIVGDKRFEVRLGMREISDLSDSPDSYALYLAQKNGALVYGLTYHCRPEGYASATEVIKIAETPLPYDFGEEIAFEIRQDYDGLLSVYAGGKLLKTVSGLPRPGGYIGFMQSGASTDGQNYIEAELDDVCVYNRYDERPENTGIDLDFSSGEINVNEWHVSSNASYGRTGGVYVGDGALRFDNVGNDSKFVTKYRYANFEMTFDIVDLRRRAVKDAFGNKIYPVSSVFGVMFGIETYAATFMSMYMQSPMLSFQTTVDAETWEKAGDTVVTLYGSDANDAGTALPEKYDFFDPANEDKRVNVFVSHIDSRFVVKLKYEGETEWHTVYDKTFGRAYIGHIAVWGMGAGSTADMISCGQFAIDNLKIANRDSVPNTVEVPFVSNRQPAPGDYIYQDRDDDEEFLIEDMKIPKGE